MAARVERVAARVAARIAEGPLDEGTGVEEIAAEFHMSSRQLRRVVRRDDDQNAFRPITRPQPGTGRTAQQIPPIGKAWQGKSDCDHRHEDGREDRRERQRRPHDRPVDW